ncbi:MAG: NADPH-dependent FMN reductase [Micropepsaceae bacterium]
MKVLGISGSLRAQSSNGALLEAAVLLAPAGMTVSIYDGVGRLPHFNPDMEAGELPGEVAAFRAAVNAADALLVSAPEYARGIPGSFKNALDWLVGDTEFAGKPVAIWTASARAKAGPAALLLVLTTMSGAVVEAASVTVDLMAGGWTGARIAADGEKAGVLVRALEALGKAGS